MSYLPGAAAVAAPGTGARWASLSRLPAHIWAAFKWAFALAFSLVLLGGSSFNNGRFDHSHGTLALLGFEALGLIALLWRPRFPVQVTLVVAAFMVSATFTAGSVPNGPYLIETAAAYSLVLRRAPPLAIGAAFVAWLATAIADVVHGGAALGQPLEHLVLLIAAVAIALFIRSQRALLAAAQERAEHAERDRALEATRAVGDERARIARELHDVVAHHVSLLVVQAGAVRETLGADHPSREVLDSMIDGGRKAMSELRAMLGALRSPELVAHAAGEAAPAVPVALMRIGPEVAARTIAQAGGAHNGLPRSPQPSLADIGALVDGARSAGLPVELSEQVNHGQLPPSVALAAYRITQEALTNVVKHAPGAPTTVSVVRRPGGVFVRVENGKGLLPVATVPGHTGQGLVGMRERAAICGGWARTVPEGDGFVVEAWLPTPEGQ